jgi:hypothetical protein
MQGIYHYIHEINHVSRVYIAADILYLQFIVHVDNVISRVECFELLY